MGCDYCSPPAPGPEPDTPLAAPSEKTSSCQDSCCDSDDAEPLDTTASGQKVAPREKQDDCCSPRKCEDNKTENHTNAPDCCHGKVSPCCDTFCLDRLAMRECELSAAAGPGSNSEYPRFENGVQRFLTPFSLRWSYRPQGMQRTSSLCPRPLRRYSANPGMYLPRSHCSWPGNLL